MKAISARSPRHCIDACFDSGFTLPIGPAYPQAGRTIFKGYLFVGDVLLSESGMRDHPLTPMRDPSLVRVLQRQSRGKVGLVQHATVAKEIRGDRRGFRQAQTRQVFTTRSSMRSPTATLKRSAQRQRILR